MRQLRIKFSFYKNFRVPNCDNLSLPSMKNFTLFIFLILAGGLYGQKNLNWFDSRVGGIFFEKTGEHDFALRKNFDANDSTTSEATIRFTAIVLNIALGTFGMHRIYLGTDVMVPVFYTCTLGGGMVLWLIDLGNLITVKDISKFYDNPSVFMWQKSP